jgi:hypothetical protein
MFLHFLIVSAYIIFGGAFIGFACFVAYRIFLRMSNLYFTVEQHMSVKHLKRKGIEDLDDDKRFVVIDALKEIGVPFGDACKFITNINQKLNDAAPEDGWPENEIISESDTSKDLEPTDND